MTMRLYDDLLQSVHGEDCEVRRVVIGLHWTVVQSRHLGMAHTFRSPSQPEVEDAGRLVGQSALTLARRLLSWNPLEASLGLAALNSMIGSHGTDCDVNRRILELSRGRTVAVVGRFPFVEDLRRVARATHCLEIDPLPDELPAAAAEVVIPGADIVAITATALINKTMPRLLELSRGRTCIVLGPSTPMNEVLLDHGAEILEGVRLTDADALAACIGQGVKKFRRLLGIQPITLTRGGGIS
jgi:uncharacterized protein